MSVCIFSLISFFVCNLFLLLSNILLYEKILVLEKIIIIPNIWLLLPFTMGDVLNDFVLSLKIINKNCELNLAMTYLVDVDVKPDLQITISI